MAWFGAKHVRINSAILSTQGNGKGMNLLYATKNPTKLLVRVASEGSVDPLESLHILGFVYLFETQLYKKKQEVEAAHAFEEHLRREKL